jgi:methyl-accepting chemotaxis protein
MYRYIDRIDIYIKYVDILIFFRHVVDDSLLTHIIKTAPTNEGRSCFYRKTFAARSKHLKHYLKANIMTDDELRILVANLAKATVSNTEAIARQSEGLASLQASAESQARSIESMREGISFNTETMASAVELAASSQRTAAAAMELSASTSRAIDRSERNITRLEQMVEIIIKDNQADRARITGLEGQG